MLYELHCKGAAFDWSKLVKRSGGGRSARGGGGGGGDGGGDGGGGGGGGSMSDEEAKAKLSKEIEAEEKVFALLKARVIGLQQNTSGGATDHELLTGLLPELLAELTASHQKLAALRQRALDGIFSAVASPARTVSEHSEEVADYGDDENMDVEFNIADYMGPGEPDQAEPDEWQERRRRGKGKGAGREEITQGLYSHPPSVAERVLDHMTDTAISVGTMGFRAGQSAASGIGAIKKYAINEIGYQARSLVSHLKEEIMGFQLRG